MHSWIVVKAAFVRSWAWLKKHWKWLIVPIGAALWLLGRLSPKKAPVVVDGEYAKHLEAKEKIDAAAEAQRAAANAALEQKLAGVEASHAGRVGEVQRDVVSKVDAAKESSESVNDFLKQVGKDMRR